MTQRKHASPETWGQQLARYRRAAGLSLRRLGQDIDVAFSTLARIERGEGAPGQHTKHAVEQRLFPNQTPTPCHCPRCTLTPREDRLATLEKRVTTLETQIQALYKERT
jgi:DNA-binding XRE family transcriptional regulator